MQHGPIARRHLFLALTLALVAGVRAAAAESISLEWDPNPEHEVVGYRVYVGNQPGVYNSSVDVGNNTTYTYASALAGTRYCFAVAAYFAGNVLGSRSSDVCTDANQPPTLQAPGNQSSAVGTALTLTLVASDPENLPVTFSATGLPVGVTLNTNTGFISGTPTTIGTSSVMATASDGVMSTSQAFTWAITSSAPAVATLLRPTGTIATQTPTFEWESVATATMYRLWVDDASAVDPKVQIDLTPLQAGCQTSGAVCHVNPGITLQPGRASWSIRTSSPSGAGPWSGAMDFTVPDGKIPTVTIATPTTASTFTTSASTIALAGTAADDAAVALVTWTNNLGGSGGATGTTSWSVASVPLLVGTNIITVTARDAGGNVGTDILTVTKGDGQAPVLSITAPTVGASGYSTSGASLAMSGTANDDAAVTQVTWTSDRGNSGTATGTTAWSAAVALKSGANHIAVTAHDAVGNKTTKSFLATMTDGEAPTVAITGPTAAATFSTGNDSVTVSGTASDAVGVTQVSWSSDRGPSGTAAGTTAWSAPVSLKSGANVITVTARDAAGNSSVDTITVTMTDGLAPVVAIAAPTAAASHTTSASTIALGGTATDAFGVTLVAWANDRGGAGTAAGTAAWSVAGVALEVGVNVITVTAKDAAGHVATDVLAVTRTDGVAPTVAITTPVAVSTFSTTAATIALGGTASDNLGVAQVTWSNSKGGNGAATGTTTWVVASVTLQPGSNVITVTAKDAAGNVATDVLTVTLTDNVAPAVAISAPTSADRHTTAAASVALGGTASDLFGVTEVRWTNDRGGSGVAAGTTSWSVPALPLLPGVNVITVTARDAAGNTSTDRLSITSDAKAPVVAITAPVATSVTKAETVALSGTASDDLGVTEVTWTNNRGGSGRAAGTSTWSIATAALQSGVNVITVVAQDAAGNRTSAAVSVTRDSQTPAVAFALPTAAGTFVTNKPALALGGKATDNTGVTQVTWQNNRGGAGAAAGTTEWAVPSVALTAGVNIITVTARDAAGNTGTATLSVTLDTRAPVIAITAPTSAPAHQTSDNVITLGGVANDDVALAQVIWTSSQGGSGVAAGTNAWTIAGIALKPGLNTLTVTARDTAGNSSTATLSVRATDVKAPSVRIVAPSADPSFSTAVAVINLEGVAADDFGIARITWVSDRGGSGVAKGDSRWIVGGLTLQPGVNVITVTAVDASGNSSTDVARISYERGLPSISLTSPTTAGTYATSSSTVALTGVASDDSGIARVRWTTDKGQAGDAVGTTAWSIPAVTVSLGTTVVTVTAYDNSGNASALSLSIVYADTAKPAVKIYTPTTASSMTTSVASVTVAGMATDNVGVVQVTWATDRGATGTAFGTGSWSTPGLSLAPGATTVVTITARDAAGNAGVAVLSVTSTASAKTAMAPGASVPTATTTASSAVTTSSLSVETASATTASYDRETSAPPPVTTAQQSSSAPLSTGSTGSGSSSARQAASTTTESSKTEAPATPPVVRILAPTAAARFTTTAASLTVAGVASHASGISVVRWSTDKGDSGIAEGTAKWTIAGLAIKPGTTVITVTAAASGGDMTNAVLTVVRPEPLPKLSVVAPTADSQWTAGTSTVALRGTASENVTRVLWSSDSGATGVADGTASWAIAGIRLQEGVNKITLTAQDANGRTDRQVLTITYRARPVSTVAAAKPALGPTAGLE